MNQFEIYFYLTRTQFLNLLVQINPRQVDIPLKINQSVYTHLYAAQSAGAVEYTDCISADG